MMLLAAIRNRKVAFCVLLAVLAMGARVLLSAASCANIEASWDTASLYYCGDYGYSSDFLDDMRSKASAYVQAYNWGSGVYDDPYWWGRVTPFDGPAYYDSAWAVCPSGWCW